MFGLLVDGFKERTTKSVIGDRGGQRTPVAIFLYRWGSSSRCISMWYIVGGPGGETSVTVIEQIHMVKAYFWVASTALRSLLVLALMVPLQVPSTRHAPVCFRPSWPPGTRVLQKTPNIWSVFRHELYPSLCRGGQVIHPEPLKASDPVHLAETIRSNSVSLLVRA